MDPIERLKALLGDFDPSELVSIEYSFDSEGFPEGGGFEILKTKSKSGGREDFRGVYHPDGNCVGEVCIFCGRHDGTYPQYERCLGIVPGTFFVCGENEYQYCSDYCLKQARDNGRVK